MKKFIAFVILITFIPSAFAECDFSTGISKLEDGRFAYSRECHIAVGEMKQDLEKTKVQLGEYKKAIELKDLALTKSNQNTQLWMDTSLNLQGKFNTVESYKTQNQYLAFGIGVLFTGLAVWSAGQLR